MVSMRQNPYKKPDRFTVAAKKAGFPARSVFKLEEIDRRVRILRHGQRVLDLGAAPGSWLLYAAQRVGPSGKVLGVDLKPLNLALPANAEFHVGDALTLENEALATHAPYDVVLSDMAPSTTGVRFTDQARSYELFVRALEVAGALLRPGGTFVGKIFMGEDLPVARAKVRALFEKERLIRPEGTRAQSYELFVVGERRRSEREDEARRPPT
jgi:23S rRNA (uridine2552-2'-O)-methyltransferase